MRESVSPQGPPRSFSRFALLALPSLTFLGSDCRPSGPEASSAVMMASPLVFFMGLVMLAILRWLWEPLIGPRPFARKPLSSMFWVLLVLALLGNFVSPRASEWAMIAVWVFGASYLAVLLLVWRIWLHKQSESAFSKAPIAAMVAMLSPAPILILVPLEAHKDLEEALIMVPWLVPGMFGYVPFPLFMALTFEAIGRRLFPKETPQGDEKKPAE